MMQSNQAWVDGWMGGYVGGGGCRWVGAGGWAGWVWVIINLINLIDSTKPH